MLDDAKTPISLSDGPTYQNYSLAGAILLHYSHAAFQDLSQCIPLELSNKLQRGSILPMAERKMDFALRPDPKTD